jgi:hypothetical protein
VTVEYQTYRSSLYGCRFAVTGLFQGSQNRLGQSKLCKILQFSVPSVSNLFVSNLLCQWQISQLFPKNAAPIALTGNIRFSNSPSD